MIKFNLFSILLFVSQGFNSSNLFYFQEHVTQSCTYLIEHIYKNDFQIFTNLSTLFQTGNRYANNSFNTVLPLLLLRVNKLDHFYKRIFIVSKLFIINHFHKIYGSKSFTKFWLCMKIWEIVSLVEIYDCYILIRNIIWGDNNKLVIAIIGSHSSQYPSLLSSVRGPVFIK